MRERNPRTRAERRRRREGTPEPGVYGIDVKDAGSDSWVGRYACFAGSPDVMRSRTRDAGFHKRQINAQWGPGSRVPGPGLLTIAAEGPHWYRSRLQDSGWSPWERLPADYRHPPQGLAARDASLW